MYFSSLATLAQPCSTASRRRTALRVSTLFVALLALLGLGRPAAGSERRSQLENTLRRDRTPAARQRAAAALGELADTDAMPALIMGLLADREAAVRAACAEALSALADPTALPALRAASRDESQLVRKQAAAAVSKLAPEQDGGRGGSHQHFTVVVGRMGSKAKSGTMPDIPQRLREAVIKEMRSTSELDVIEDIAQANTTKTGYTIDSSVTRLTRHTTPAGELEIACDISMIIAVLPGRNVVGMVSGGASVIGPRGPSTRPTKAFLENLETEALNQAVHETHSSLMTYLRHQAQALLKQQK